MSERTLIRCSMWSPSIVLEDRVIPAWSPEGCEQKTWLALGDDITWVWHDVYPLCPVCNRRWESRWEDIAWT